jgi:hypothetical protein
MTKFTLRLATLAVAALAMALSACGLAPASGSLQLPHSGKVWLTDPVTVNFGQGTDVSKATVKLSPSTPSTVVNHGTQVVITPKSTWLPGHNYSVSVNGLANVATSSWSGSFQTASGIEPANTFGGVTANFQPKTPLQIIVENSGPARPQDGLQQADMVFEYISEYSITRMTAVYFNNPAPLIGPVRSCRLINIPLDQAFKAAVMCSGVSPGTDARIRATTNPPLHILTNDHDRGSHFFRVNFNFAPHNLFTDAARAMRWRAEAAIAAPDYSIDAPHTDVVYGSPGAAPTVPLHGVTYSYDQGSKTYLRVDEGSPFVDGQSHRQLQVKNVILMHVDYQVMNYVEDESGGAHSIFYQMTGSGPAEIYSDGSMIQATWHMDVNTPVYFTDAQGNVIRLNTGLTWIHVLGNGQTH